VNGAAIRAGLSYLLATVDGLKVYGALPSKPELPAAAVGTSDPFIEYLGSFEQPVSTLNFETLVVVTRGNGDERAAAELDLYVFQAIPDALYGDGNVNGCLYAGVTPTTTNAAAQSIVVVSASSYNPVQWNDLDLLGCRIAIQVFARRL
jgi:hypothetical protein